MPHSRPITMLPVLLALGACGPDLAPQAANLEVTAARVGDHFEVEGTVEFVDKNTDVVAAEIYFTSAMGDRFAEQELALAGLDGVYQGAASFKVELYTDSVDGVDIHLTLVDAQGLRSGELSAALSQ